MKEGFRFLPFLSFSPLRLFAFSPKEYGQEEARAAYMVEWN